MRLTGALVIECKKCHHRHRFSPDDAMFESETTDNRAQGHENQYTMENEFTCEHNGCDNEIEVIYEVWEYPEGQFSHDNVDIKGGIERGRFGYDFNDEEPPDDL